MFTKRTVWTVAPVAAGLFALAGCDIDQTREGELPDVDVDVAEGQLPEFDVRGPDIDVESEERTIDVPTGVDIETEERTIEVPDVDIDIPEENENEVR